MSSPSTTAVDRTPDWMALRERFPVLERKTYLNSCSYGALSTDVGDALRRYLDDRDRKGTDWEYWVQQNEAVRSAVARFLQVGAAEVAVTTSASAGISSIASALDYGGARNRIVISDFEFPTSAQIWYAQERRGAEVVRVRERDGYIPVESFEEAIDERTLLVAVTEVCYRNGARLDTSAIAAIARRNGALMLVDGYQDFGTGRPEVRESGIDFAVGGMVKYLLGTAGIGFLYVREPLIEALVPSMTGWFSQADIFAMDHTGFHPAPDARRFEMGTPPIPNCYAAVAGLKLLEEAEPAAVEARITELTDAIKSNAKKRGYALATPEDRARHGALITLRTRDESRLVAALDAADIVTSSRFDKLRIAPHFYNTQQDVDTLFCELRKHEHLLT